MKKILITIVMLTTILSVVNGQAGGDYDYHDYKSSNQTSTKDGSKYKTFGTIWFISSASMGVIMTTFGAIYGIYDMMWSGVGITGLGLIVSIPCWIVGAREKKNKPSTTYVPLINWDIHIKDNLTLSTNINIMNYPNVNPQILKESSQCFGIGLNLSF